MSKRVVKTVKGHRHGRVPRAFREEQLLDVAQALFAKQGYQGTSIEDIAAAAGVTRPMVYNYFESKDGIYLACLRRARSKLEDGMKNAVSGDSAQDASLQLERMIRTYFEFVETNGAAWDVLFGGGAAVAGPAATEARRLRFVTVGHIAQLLKAHVTPELEDADLMAFSHIMSGGGEQLAKWWRERPDLPREHMVRCMHSLFWFGLQRIVVAAQSAAKDGGTPA